MPIQFLPSKDLSKFLSFLFYAKFGSLFNLFVIIHLYKSFTLVIVSVLLLHSISQIDLKLFPHCIWKHILHAWISFCSNFPLYYAACILSSNICLFFMWKVRYDQLFIFDSDELYISLKTIRCFGKRHLLIIYGLIYCVTWFFVCCILYNFGNCLILPSSINN